MTKLTTERPIVREQVQHAAVSGDLKNKNKSDDSYKGIPGRADISRRNFVQGFSLSCLTLALTPVLSWGTTKSAGGLQQGGPAARAIPLDSDWFFGGEVDPGALTTSDDGFRRITLPHCVTKLSWQNWDPASWQKLWLYRCDFALPRELNHLRVFLHFDGVMVGATPAINGHELPKHLGGYLPFEYEVTEWLRDSGNRLSVVVDSRWSNVPPEGSPIGAKQVDYLEAGGIHRSVCLKAVPQIFIRDIFAKPVQVLESTRKVEVECTLDSALSSAKTAQILVELKDGSRVISRARQTVPVEKKGETKVKLILQNLGNVALWDVDAPHLYDVVATLVVDGTPVHDYRTRVGFRDARFELDGFLGNFREADHRFFLIPITDFPDSDQQFS